MSAFEYAMVLVSIIVGLGITHILSSLGSAVHRIRHHGPAIRLELAYLSWVAFIFTWLVHFWWFEFKWTDVASEIGVGLYLFLVFYAVSLFLLAVILVPHRLEIVDDSWEYFLSIRKWFYGGLLVLDGIDLVDTVLKGTGFEFSVSYLTFLFGLAAVSIVGLSTTSRRVHLSFGIAMVIGMNTLIFTQHGVLGHW